MRRERRAAYCQLAATVVACGCLAACDLGSDPILEDITAQQAIEMISNNAGSADFVVLDVRTPEEYAAGHVSGAVNINYYAPYFGALLGALNRNAVYVVYCGSGGRSGKTLEMMRELDFFEAYNVLGGYAAMRGVPWCTCIFEEPAAAQE